MLRYVELLLLSDSNCVVTPFAIGDAFQNYILCIKMYIKSPGSPNDGLVSRHQ